MIHTYFMMSDEHIAFFGYSLVLSDVLKVWVIVDCNIKISKTKVLHHATMKNEFEKPFLVLQLIRNRGIMSVPGRTWKDNSVPGRTTRGRSRALGRGAID